MTEQDTRVQCVACANYQRGYCVDAVKAGLGFQPERLVGREIAVLKQHCPAFKPK